MPRYDSLNVRDFRLLNNTVPVRNRAPVANFRGLTSYDNLTSDAKLDWSGDLVFDEKSQDLELAHTVEAYVQNLYHRLVTQSGQHPESGEFGWSYSYLYSLNVVEQKRMLPKVIRDVRDAIKSDLDTLAVIDVSAYIERIDSHHHNIVIEAIVKPRSVNDELQITFELDATGSGA